MKTWAFVAAMAVAAACSRNKQSGDDFTPQPEPIAIHVRNENFLDMNVSVVSNSTTRRLGQVTGNGSADFTIPWSMANGSGVVLTARPIGGSGSATSPSLNVSPGQVIDFKIASVLRQSVAVVHDP